MSNLLLKKGKGQVTSNLVLRILREAKKKYKLGGDVFLYCCIENARPYVSFMSKKVGKHVYKIPISLTEQKEVSLALQWIVVDSCGRKLGSMEPLIESELNKAYKGNGFAQQHRKKQHLFAEQNRIYLRYL